MKISIFLKVALCAFLCSIVCVIGFILTNIDIFALLTNCLWLVTYVSLVAWLCNVIRHKVRYGINLCFCIASFAIALYLGTMLSLGGNLNLASINNLEYASLPVLAFIFFSVVCACSIMVLICRFIFGNGNESAKSAIPPFAFNPISKIQETDVDSSTSSDVI